MYKSVLLSNLKSDIEESFEYLIESGNVNDEQKIIQEAKEYLTTHLEKDYTKETLSGLKKGWKLIKFVERCDNDNAKKIALAALEYLIDPWDLIPDFVANKGFLDDIYVFDLALNQIRKPASNRKKKLFRNIPKKDENWILMQLGGASGPHLAKRAKNLNILDSYQRKAIFDIGRKQLFGYDLTQKQCSFFETLVNKIVQSGVLEYKCPDSPCEYCSKLKDIYY